MGWRGKILLPTLEQDPEQDDITTHEQVLVDFSVPEPACTLGTDRPLVRDQQPGLVLAEPPSEASTKDADNLNKESVDRIPPEL